MVTPTASSPTWVVGGSHYGGATVELGDRVVLLDPDLVTRPQQI